MTRRGTTVQALADTIPGARLVGAGASQVTGMTYDSRLVQPGDIFVALRGADFDGHAFIDEAERLGAAALLVESHATSPLPQIQVADSRATLAELSATFYGHPSHELGVIGITGTDGKTTTSYLVDHVLRSAGLRTGMVGTVAIRVGDREDLHPSRQSTPESSDVQCYLRQMADHAVDWAVLEATSHGLAMHRLDHVRFRIGAVTNVTHEHLDFHGTVEDYRRAKAILLERVADESGTVVVNVDDPGARAIAAFGAGAAIMHYSPSGQQADLRAVQLQSNSAGSRFDLEVGPNDRVTIDLPLIGEFNIANAVCAAGIALAAGVNLAVVAKALATAPPIPGRMAPVDMGQPFTVFVDYAHTPDALEKVLRLLRRLHPSGRLIAVFGSAGERDVEKRPLQGRIAARLADVSVITSEDPRFEDADAIIAQVAAGSEAGGAVLNDTLHCRRDRREAIRLAFSLAQPGDCIVLAGKGHEGSIIWGRDKVPWDEAGVARELLLEAGHSRSD